jgi:hypothetical protein
LDKAGAFERQCDGCQAGEEGEGHAISLCLVDLFGGQSDWALNPAAQKYDVPHDGAKELKLKG